MQQNPIWEAQVMVEKNKRTRASGHDREHQNLARGAKPPSGLPGSEAEKSLLAEIGRLGGEERAKGAEGALAMFETGLSELVRQNPKAYGADDDGASQKQVVAQMVESLRISFLKRTAAELHQKAGCVQVFGCWVHRAAFTFVGFGLIAAFTLPLCAVSLMSTRPWGWLPGAFGIAGAVAVGVWILSRIRSK